MHYYFLFQCLAKAAAKHGVKALMNLVPGGEAFYQIVSDAWNDYSQHPKGDDLRAKLQDLAETPPDRVLLKAQAAVQARAAGESPEDQETITLFLIQVPSMIRRWLRHPPAEHRPEDILKEILLSPGGVITISPGMEFAWIPPGAFLMGDNNHTRKARPAHRVTLSKGFYMGVYPVTQKQCRAVMNDYNPSKFQDDSRPVEGMTWDDCQDFCRKLAALTGETIRLPTEAEWERACRAGTNRDYYNGDGEEKLRQVGWYDQNSLGETHPVGQLKPNSWGLYDMHGNVWEWCADWYGKYGAKPLVDPRGPDTGKDRVMRGGSWCEKADDCRAAFRGYDVPKRCAEWAGFRVCFDLD